MRLAIGMECDSHWQRRKTRTRLADPKLEGGNNIMRVERSHGSWYRNNQGMEMETRGEELNQYLRGGNGRLVILTRTTRGDEQEQRRGRGPCVRLCS